MDTKTRRNSFGAKRKTSGSNFALSSRTRIATEQTQAEGKLWDALVPTARAAGYKFRRQHPIAPYIVDFVCLSCGVVVELDGDSHDATVEGDKRRTSYLESKGFHVIRFANEEVAEDVGSVVDTIMREVLLRKVVK